MHFSMQRTPAWARDARKLIKRTYGKGWVVRPQRSGRLDLGGVDGQEGSGTIDTAHDPEHHPIGSTQEQGVGISSDQGANQEFPLGGAQ